MKFIIALLLSLTSSSCIIPDNPQVPAEFSIIYSQFLTDAARFHRDLDLWNLVIEFGPLPEGTLGKCAPPKTVTILPEAWNRFDRWGKELLLFHELGHCLLGQSHRVGTIMDPTPIFGSLYAQKREEFLTEFFYFQSRTTTPAYTHEGDIW